MIEFFSPMPEIMFEDEELVVRRPQNTLGDGLIFVGGKRVFRPGAYTDFTVRCTVQPVGGKDLILEAEGDRFGEQLWFWVPTPYEQPQPNDFMVREGELYHVQQATGWGSGAYTKVLGVRVDVGPDRALGV